MTNRDRLNRMSTEDYTREVAAFASCPVRRYVDYEAWLESSEPEYPLLGSDAEITGSGSPQACKMVGEYEYNGEQFCRVVLKRRSLHDFELRTVKRSQVRLL